MRSSGHPTGFPWPAPGRQGRLHLADTLAEFSIAALVRQLARRGAAVLERPKGLGATSAGPWDGRHPKSMWQLPGRCSLGATPGARHVRLLQSDFGTPYPKPAGLALTNLLLEGP